MTQVQPKNKFLDIIKQINVLGNQELQADTIKIKLDELKLETKRLIEINPADANSILGMIYCTQKNIPAMHKHHKDAIAYGGGLYAAKQYCISLQKLFLNKEGYKKTKKLLQENKNDWMLNKLMVEFAYALELNEEFEEYSLNYFDITNEKHWLDAIFPEDDDEILSEMIDMHDKIISEQPDSIVEFDEDMINLAYELVEGVKPDENSNTEELETPNAQAL